VEKLPLIRATDAMSTMAPPPDSLIKGAQVWIRRTVAVTLIWTMSFQESTLTSGNMFSELEPTLFIGTCKPPTFSLMFSAAASYCSWSTTSSSTK
jgi:hypothetical protein